MYILNELPIFPPAVVGLDIETNGLDRFGCRIIAVGLSDGKNTWILTEDFGRVVPLLEDPACLKIVHNADFDITILAHRYSCKPVNIWDTLVVERLLNNGLDISNELDQAIGRRLGLFMDKSVRKSFVDYEGEITEEQLAYLEEDVIHLPALRVEQLKDVNLTKTQKVVKIENKVIESVADMTVKGIRFNVEEWNKIEVEIKNAIDLLTANLINYLGNFVLEVERIKDGNPYIKTIPVMEINFDSSSQVKAMFHAHGIKVPSCGKDVLVKYREHTLVDMYMELKRWLTMTRWKWDEFINPETGKIHPKWNQLGTITGRFSASDPNMQQVPKPEDEIPGKLPIPNFRRLFMPDEGHTLICMDFGQEEPRLLAAISGDTQMIIAASSQDIYSAYAKDIWGVEVSKKDPRRQKTKIGVLALFYGVWCVNLAPKMGITEKEAETFEKEVFTTYPVAKRWGDRQIYKVLQNGYVTTATGRRIYWNNLPVILANPGVKRQVAREARNYPIQGSGGDVIKLSMIKIHDLILQHGYDAHLVWSIHDEVGISVKPDQAEELFPLAIKAAEDAATEICPGVKYVVEGKITDEWEH